VESNHVQRCRGDGGLITLRTPQQTIFATSTHKDKDVYTTSEYPQTESFVRMLRNSAIAKKLRDILTQAVVINRHRIGLIYTSLFTNMVAHKKKIQTYKQKAV